MNTPCPCGLPQSYVHCCGARISGQCPAETPEALMRSRYTAFSEKNLKYILETTWPADRPRFDFEANLAWAQAAIFTRLEVLSATHRGDAGQVQFRAHFRIADENHVHEERSLFKRAGENWFYLVPNEVPPT